MPKPEHNRTKDRRLEGALTEEIKRDRSAAEEKEKENAAITYKKKLALDRARDEDKFKRDNLRTNERGELVSHWEGLSGEIEAILKKDVTSMHDWRNAMMNFLNLCNHLNEALSESLGQQTHKLGVPLLFKQALGLDDDSKVQKFKDNYLPKGGKVELPALAHHVSFTPDNKLEIAPLLRTDKATPVGNALNGHFKTGVCEWLKEHRYSEVPGKPGEFVNDQGLPLDKATFDALKEHPDDGLKAFLAKGYDLQFVEGGGPRPY